MNQKKYTQLIASEIPTNKRINLLSPMEIEGETARYSTKLGFCASKKINLTVSNIYTRSVEISIDWDSKSEKFLLFCPTNKSPDKIYYDLHNKCSNAVNNSYTNEELSEIQSQARENLGKKIKDAISRGDFKILE